MGRKQEQQEPYWSARDDALWTTAELALLTRQGRLGLRQPVSVPFAMEHAMDEHPYATGSFRLLAHQGQGDGTYAHDSSFLYAHGRGAVPLMVGFTAVRALGNASRRRHAAEAAQPRWTVIDAGTITVSGHGFYLHTPTALLPWNWNSIQLATLVGPGALKIMGQSTSGPVSWVLESDWAELVFFFWASVRCPGHEQLTGRTWLPEEWVTRAFTHSFGSGDSHHAAAFRELSRGLGIGLGT